VLKIHPRSEAWHRLSDWICHKVFFAGRERRVMWGLFVGVSLAVMLYSFIEEWQQRRLNKKHLTKMRKDFVAGRHWDVRKGQWDDD
jgi:hypothetical protein